MQETSKKSMLPYILNTCVKKREICLEHSKVITLEISARTHRTSFSGVGGWILATIHNKK